MKIITSTYIFLILGALKLTIHSAPTKSDFRRSQKSLSYFDYMDQSTEEDNNSIQNFIDAHLDFPNDAEDYDNINELSRTIQTRKRKRPNVTRAPMVESPIYYIRLPAQPYVFIPGLGYVSQPAQTGPGGLLNLPVNFMSNGKPGAIYQWGAGYSAFAAPVKPVTKPPKAKPRPKPVDSKVFKLPGKYIFNGKPNEVYTLGDSYNSVYDDTLDNFYP